MNWQYTPLVWILICACLVMAPLGLYAWGRRKTPGASAFAALMVLGLAWAVLYICEITRVDLPAKIFFHQWQFPFIAFIPVAMLVMAQRFIGRPDLVSWRRMALLSILPVISSVLALTSMLHPLFRYDYRFNTIGIALALEATNGVWFFIHAAYSYLLSLLAIVTLARNMRHLPDLARRQTTLLLAAQLIPMTLDGLSVAGVQLVPGINLAVPGIAVSGLLITWGLFSYHVFDMLPAARTAVVESLPEAIFVWDNYGRVIDVNPTAERILGVPVQQVIGRPVEDLKPLNSALPFGSVGLPAEDSREVCLTLGGERRCFEWGVSRLTDRVGTPVGWMLSLRDMTERQRLEDALRQARDTAEALRVAGTALTSTLDFNQLLDLVMDQTELLVPCDTATILMIQAGRAYPVRSRGYDKLGISFTGNPDDFSVEIGALSNIKTVVETHSALVVPDMSVSPERTALTFTQHIRSWVGAPIVVEGQVVGLFSVSKTEPGYYNEEHAKRLVALANQAGLALENARLYREAQEHLTQQSILNEIGRSLSSALELEELLSLVHQQVSRLLDAQNFYIATYEEDADEWMMVFALENGLRQPVIRGSAGAGLTGYIIRSRQALLFGSDTERRAFLERTGVRALGTSSESWMAVPLISKDRVVGVMCAQHPERQNLYDTADLDLFMIIGASVAAAIQNARLYDAAQQRARDLAEANLVAQEARAAAEAAAKAKSTFLASMSHEIRTPLNGVIGMTSLLHSTELSMEQQDYVDVIRTSSETLLTIISDVLDFSKIEAGKLEMELQPFDLRGCVEDALDLVGVHAGAKGLELAYFLEEQTPPVIIGDVTRLRQILTNLLNNAIKFTEKGEVVVCVSARLPEPFLEKEGAPPDSRHVLHFSVRDSGIGIPAEKLGRLFQSFSQLDSSTTRKYGGTGLGLAISQQLTELMEGRMWVESTGIPGQGSTFHFTILAAAGELPKGEQDAAQVMASLAGRRMLAVDDNSVNRMILSRYAGLFEMEAETASSAAEALARLEKAAQAGRRFDVAVLDMQMPEVDGLMLAQAIHQLPAWRALPLVLLTSLGVREADVPGGVFASCVNKPIKPAQLREVLQHLLSAGTGTVCAPVNGEAIIQADLGARVPLRILLAEDNLVNQKVALRVLEKLGYRADLASNGIEVLEAMKRQDYDVILMDVQMPEMDGEVATQRIRTTLPASRQPRIIALTANALETDRERYLSAGMDDYLSKPLRIAQLQLALRHCGAADVPAAEKPPAPTDDAWHREITLPPELLSQWEGLGMPLSEILTEVVPVFLDETPANLETIRAALEQQNLNVAMRLAHSLKGESGLLGMRGVMEAAFRLEQASRQGDLENARVAWSEVEAAYRQADALLRQVLAQTGSREKPAAIKQ